MSALRGFLAGTLAVATAEMVVSSPAAAGRIGAFGDFLGVVIDRVVNPDIPAIGSASFAPPLPAIFGGTTSPAPPPGPLRSTKAKPPRPTKTAPGTRRMTPPGGN